MFQNLNPATMLHQQNTPKGGKLSFKEKLNFLLKDQVWSFQGNFHRKALKTNLEKKKTNRMWSILKMCISISSFPRKLNMEEN